MVRNSDRNRLFDADVEHESGEVRRRAGQRQHADDDADDRAGDADADRLPRAVDQAVAHDRERRAAAAHDEIARATRSAIMATIRPDAELEERSRRQRPARTRTRSGTASSRSPAAMPTPRISIAVSARPTIPEYIGVKPSNSMNTSTASGSIRYHLLRIARHGFGHSALGMPCRPARPGLEVDHHERGDVVEERRNDRRLDDRRRRARSAFRP